MEERTLQEIRDRAAEDIVELVAEHGNQELKRSGRYRKATCPFHDENTASFTVTPAKGIYKCFGCGAGGDAIDFLQQVNGWDFWDTVQYLADRYGVELEPKAQQKRDSYKEYMESVLPGILEARADIRRKGKVTLCFHPKAFQQAGAEHAHPVLHIDAPLNAQQVDILLQYNDELHVTLICTGLTRRGTYNATYQLLTGGVPFVFLAKSAFDDPQHWFAFIPNHFEQTESLKKACLKLIARIPDGLSRSIHMKEFSEHWL